MVEIGFLADARNASPWARPWPEVYSRTLELVEEADRLGAGVIFLGEHHLTDDGYVPQPLTFAAAIAARTKRIRLGTSVTIASIRHPMHVAEEAAVVDVLSNGRLELGLGAGYAPDEFAAFGVERADRFRLLDRTVAEVRRLLTEVVTPRPVQERVPIWCGYFGRGARRAGLLGEGLMSMQPECLEAYREGLAEGGHDPDDARMASPLDLIVVDDPERARARLQPHIDYQASEYAKYQAQVDRAEGRDPAVQPRYGAANHESYQVLTPDDAITMIRERTRGLPVKYVTPWLTVGGMPDEIAEEHVTLVSTRVAPALRTVEPT
jgi:alkanesulfonate monooxygenase SsuD/methylene tetrahydromethanopterin reductase-like flavin-dependent oxidoreductase (luciferase family)